MFKGIVVLAVMAAIWCELGYLLTQAQPWLYIWPPLVSLAFVALAYPRYARLPARLAAEEKRVGRLIGTWTLFEGAAISIVGTILANTGASAFIPAALATIVGVHFLPLARALPVSFYYGTGLIMIAAGALAIGASPVFGTRALGLVCGAALWLTAGLRAWTDTRRVALPPAASGAG